MDDVLRTILARADMPDYSFNGDEVESWPLSSLELFTTMGLLVEGPPVGIATCGSCGHDHVEQIHYLSEPSIGNVGAFLFCPEAGIVSVSTFRLRTWGIALNHLVGLLSQTLALRGMPAEISPNRVWRLGSGSLGKTGVNVFFLRGLNWPDGSRLLNELPRSAHPLVLVPCHRSIDENHPAHAPAIVALSDVATVIDHRVQLDTTHLATAIHNADELRRLHAHVLEALDPKRHTRRLRRQVLEVVDSFVSNEVLIAAYKVHGSYRRAAKALSQGADQKVSKDRVKRAVDAAGGIQAVLNKESSRSIQRQPRTRVKNNRTRF